MKICLSHVLDCTDLNVKLADAPHVVNRVRCWLLSKTSGGDFEHCKNTDDLRDHLLQETMEIGWR
jgi:hypothetical protein